MLHGCEPSCHSPFGIMNQGTSQPALAPAPFDTLQGTSGKFFEPYQSHMLVMVLWSRLGLIGWVGARVRDSCVSLGPSAWPLVSIPRDDKSGRPRFPVVCIMPIDKDRDESKSRSSYRGLAHLRHPTDHQLVVAGFGKRRRPDHSHCTAQTQMGST
jgi:hypothetical protein